MHKIMPYDYNVGLQSDMQHVSETPRHFPYRSGWKVVVQKLLLNIVQWLSSYSTKGGATPKVVPQQLI